MEGTARRARPLGAAPGLLVFGLLLGPLTPAAAQDGASANANALTAAYNASGQDLFKRFAAIPGNIVFSPYSIGTAMAMALAGARGNTEREMAKALRHRLPRGEIDAANAGVLATLNGYDKGAVESSCPAGMRIDGNRCHAPPDANRGCPPAAAPAGDDCIAEATVARSAKLVVADALMLTRSGAPVSKDYVALLAGNYAAEVFQTANVDDVNGWVNRKTEGKIDRILDEIGSDTAAVILNAVYFKAKWAAVFRKEATRDDPFSLTARRKVSVPTMHRNGSYALVSRSGYRAIRLPYEVAALGMIIVLPNEINGLARVSAQLNTGELARLTAALKQPGANKRVDLALPKFRLNYKADLVPPFRQAGMKLAFDASKADFSGITGRPPAEQPTAIGQIAHRAFIDVMEDGTEAAAATAVTITVTSVQRPPQRFTVDRPFLCYIVDDATGAILFQARVVDPR